MQFNVPQFIEVEDKIFGPLTLKQFLMFLGGGILLVFVWFLFSTVVVVIVAIPLVAFLIASVFVKINGRSFLIFLKSWIKYLLNPRTYVWKRKT
jgi:hypothetical protein